MCGHAFEKMSNTDWRVHIYLGFRASPTCAVKSGAVNARFGALYTVSARVSEFTRGRGAIFQRALLCEKRTSGRGAILQRARGIKC
jgi:hypothetical protein